MKDVTTRFKADMAAPKKPSAAMLELAWRCAVRAEANNRCQFPGCGRYSLYLQAHHIASRKQRPDLRYEVSNGLALCATPCHQWVTEHPTEAGELGLVSHERYEKRDRT